MKATFRSLRLWLLLGAVLLPLSAHAAGLALNPTSINSAYAGNVTLTITGVPSGATVTAELFLDYNANSAVDAGEPLIRRFNVTDGQLPMIGGVRNGNVPGDDDGAVNGQMTVNVSYRKTNEPDHFKGQFFWRVTSPGPATNLASFSVMSPSPAQPVNISGTVSGASFCAVVLVNPAREDGLVTGVLTDMNGAFSVVAAPGTYLVVATRCGSGAGFVSDFSNPALISFPTGGTTNGLTLGTSASPRTITGRVVDDLGNGLGGLFVEANSTNNLFALAFTDANGDFSLNATSSEWEVAVSSWNLAQGGYVGLHQDTVVNATTGSVANVNFTAPRANALIYGTASEGGTNFVGLVQIGGVNEPSHTYEAASVTDASGNYWLGVFGGYWSHSASGADALQAGFLLSQGGSRAVATNAAVRVDFAARVATGTVSGRLVDEGGQGVGGLAMMLTSFSSVVQAEGQSAELDGSFTLGWFAGNWSLGVNSFDAANRNLLAPSLNFTNGGSSNLANVNVVLKNINATLSGTLRDTLGGAVPYALIIASANVNGQAYTTSTNTDFSGNYSLRLFGFTNWTLGAFGLSTFALQDVSTNGVVVSGNSTLNLVTTRGGPVQMVASSPLPAGNTNSAYSYQFQAEGGVMHYSWSLNPGTLPAGLTLSTDGLLSGTPTVTGTFTFTVAVTDVGGPPPAQHNRVFSLTINANGPADSTPPTLVQTTPQNFQQGVQTHSGIAFTFSEPMQANQSIAWSGNVNPAFFRYTWATNGLTLFCTYGTLPTSSTISWTLNPTGQSNFRDLAGNALPSNITGSFKTVATNATGVPDALQLVVFKTANFLQTNATTADVVPVTTNTHSYGVSIKLSGHVTVTNIASDINGSFLSYVPFSESEGDSYDFESQAFTSKAQVDAAFPNGNHNFSLRTVHNGTNNVTVTLNGDAYPAAPFVSNFAAAQSVNSSNSFTLNWNPFTNGTADDFIFVEVNERLTTGAYLDICRTPDLGELGALNGTVTSVTFPAGTFAAGAVYDVNIIFIKGVHFSTTGYPPLVAGAYGAEMSFKLLTAGTPAQPSLGFTTVPGETHRHVLVTGEAYRQYQLQAATNLSSPLWQVVSTLRTMGRTNLFDDPASPSHPRRFYRAILVRD